MLAHRHLLPILRTAAIKRPFSTFTPPSAKMTSPYGAYPHAPLQLVDPVHDPKSTQKPLNVNKEDQSHFKVQDKPAGADQGLRNKNKTAPLLVDSPLKGKVDNVHKLKMIGRDFRSDTITIPSEEMLEEMMRATRGDDVYGDDDTTNTFQAEIAALTGKESAMFVPTGTLSNQLALRTHLVQPPYAVLCDTRCHIHRYEAGGLAFHSGASTEIVMPSNGHHLRWEQDILPNLSLDDDIHFAPTKIIALENTCGGTIFPQYEVVKISEEARSRGLIMHLDGARIWNVAAETGLSIKELCDPFDTVSLCLSKGLGAPIGSILVGPSAFIKKARHFRKLFGAGTRQTGGLVAVARFAVQHNYPKLAGTHELAKYAGRELEKLGVRLTAPVETSMVFLDTSSIDIPISELVSRAASLPEPICLGGGRMAFHFQIQRQAIDDLLDLIQLMKDEKKNGTGSSTPVTNGKMGPYAVGGSALQAIGASSASKDHMKHSVFLTLPFPSRESAMTLQKAIAVDKELRPKDTRKEFSITPTNQGIELAVKIFATTVRHLRLSVNAFLEDAALVCRTMSEFDPLQKQLDEAKKLQLELDLEQGSVGIAG